MDSKRAEAFSDGVFSVAITVLVFNLLGAASGSHALTYRLLLNGWPNYFAYAVSFPSATSRASTWVWCMTS